jgi:hypothetical protein
VLQAYKEKLRPLPCSHECFAGAAAEVRSNSSYYYILRISRYRRASGSDLTASTPSVAAAAASVIAVTYPSVRIIFLLLLRGSATAARDVDVPHPGAGSKPSGPPAAGLTAHVQQAYSPGGKGRRPGGGAGWP